MVNTAKDVPPKKAIDDNWAWPWRHNFEAMTKMSLFIRRFSIKNQTDTFLIIFISKKLSQLLRNKSHFILDYWKSEYFIENYILPSKKLFLKTFFLKVSNWFWLTSGNPGSFSFTSRFFFPLHLPYTTQALETSPIFNKTHARFPSKN